MREWLVDPANRSVIGVPYEWEPKIWDPMAPSQNIKVTFSSPAGTLPSWLHWEEGTRLTGTPDVPQPAVHVFCKADFIDGAGSPSVIEMDFTIQVSSMSPSASEQTGYAAPAAPMMPQWSQGVPPVTEMDMMVPA